MRKNLITILAIGLCTFCISGIANATLIAEWDFDDHNQNVLTTDTITLYATIYNNSTDNETVSALNAIFSLGNANSDYLFSFGNYRSIIDLAPGESANFFFGTLNPIGGEAHVGDYSTRLSRLAINTSSGNWHNAQTNFSWTATAAPAPAPAPEPATMLLFGTGLVALVGSRIRKNKKQQ